MSVIQGSSVRRHVDRPTATATAAAPPQTDDAIHFTHTHISPRSIELATETLRTGWVSAGAMAERFEQALCATLGIRNAVTVNSGTSALHLALDLAGVGHGDEVILPPQTFVATGLVVLMQQATAVFADVDPQTGNIDPASIAEKITPRTKAIMVVHFGGYPCDMDEINALAARHGLPVIEDAAHALGATYRGRPVGNLSRLTAFSFQATKHLTTGDGGMLATLSDEEAHLARRRRWFGIDRRADKPSLLGERMYRLDHVGYKYHMNDLAAAVGLGNLEDFHARLARRRQNAQRYLDQLEGVAGLELIRPAADRTHSYWVFTVLVQRRDDFVRKLASQGVPASVVHLRIDRHEAFGGVRTDLTGQARFEARQIALPVHEGLRDDQIDRIITAVRGGW